MIYLILTICSILFLLLFDKNNLEGFIYRLLVLSVMIVSFSCWKDELQIKPEDTKPYEKFYSTEERVVIRDSVIEFIKYLNLKHPEIVLAQAEIESGNFNSKVFKRNNNMFGMRMPKARANIAEKDSMGYAYYPHWKYSIIDYALYQASYLNIKSKDAYLAALQRTYAEDPSYSAIIKKRSNNVFYLFEDTIPKN